jgi:SNF2 family DNA or RNA helicase
MADSSTGHIEWYPQDNRPFVSPFWEKYWKRKATKDNETEIDEEFPFPPPPMTASEFLKSSFHFPRADGTYELPGIDPIEYLGVPRSRMTQQEVEDDKIGDISMNLLEQHFHDFDGIKPVEKPSYIQDNITLADYQLQGVAEGLARLKKHSKSLPRINNPQLTSVPDAFVLTDDMGLGKTIQALIIGLSLVKEFPREPREGGILIVVPAAAIAGWEHHLETFFQGPEAPSYVIAHRNWTSPKNSEFSMSFADMRQHDIVICTIQALQDERSRAQVWIRTGGIPVEARRFRGQSLQYHTLIIDEVHLLRNPETQSFAAAGAVKARYRIGLSGTIFRNAIGDWHSIFRILRWAPWDNEDMFKYAFASIELPKPAFSKTPILARPTKSDLQRWDIARKQIIYGRTETALNLPALHEIEIKVTLNEYEKGLVRRLWAGRRDGASAVFRAMHQ